jgi:1,4-alpha-glucan branching enzyme
MSARSRPRARSRARTPPAGLADLGVSVIELMPVADFPGRRNWGYDGVLLYAPIPRMVARKT